MSIEVRPKGDGFLVVGDTYDARDLLKRRGGRWNRFAAAWEFAARDEAVAAAAAATSHVKMVRELEAL